MPDRDVDNVVARLLQARPAPWRRAFVHPVLWVALLLPMAARHADGATPAAVRNATCPAVTAIRPVPQRPRPGTLFRIRVIDRAAAPQSLHASVAGEVLHWQQHGDTLVAFAAVPVDSGDGVTLMLRCADTAGRTDSSVVRIGASAANYRMEKLTVAPQFAAPPDSALAARLRAESERAADVSRIAHTTPKLWRTPFLAPRDARITSTFGSGRVFNGEVTSRHMGTDFAGAVGAPVRAANRGIVRIVAPFYLGGNVIYLDHGDGIVTAYLHLSKQLVAVGDTVARGQVIGRVGATGRVTGPHLHLIARYGAITVDPMSLLGKQE